MRQLTLSKIAIIAGEPMIAERVCAHFRWPGTYVALQAAPGVRMVAEGVFTADCLRLTNVIRAHEPEMVFLLGCSLDVSNELRVSLPPVPIVEMNEVDGAVMEGAPGFRARPLTAVDQAKIGMSEGHVVAVEGGDAMAFVIAQNLAVAEGGSVFVMPSVSEDEAEQALEWWRCWCVEGGIERGDARQALLTFLRKQVGPLVNGKVGSISFITRGVPYGVYPFACPTTHHFSYPLLGESVLGG